jgi:hypothetical protein
MVVVTPLGNYTRGPWAPGQIWEPSPTAQGCSQATQVKEMPAQDGDHNWNWRKKKKGNLISGYPSRLSATVLTVIPLPSDFSLLPSHDVEHWQN